MRLIDFTHFLFVAAHSFVLATPPAIHNFSRAWFSTVTLTSLVFKVKACQDAQLALTRYPGDLPYM